MIAVYLCNHVENVEKIYFFFNTITSLRFFEISNIIYNDIMPVVDNFSFY